MERRDMLTKKQQRAAKRQGQREKSEKRREDRNRRNADKAKNKADGNGTKKVVHPVESQSGAPNKSKPPPESVVLEEVVSGDGNDTQEVLAPLIKPEKADTVKVGSLIMVDPRRVLRDETQPRTEFDVALLQALAASIQNDGQEEPGHIFRLEGHDGYDWMLINGERRKLACEIAGVPYLAIVKRRPASDLDRLTSQVASNENRAAISPVDRAMSIARLLEAGRTIAQIARLYGDPGGSRSDGWVYQQLRICELDPRIHPLMSLSIPKDQRIGPSVAIELAKLPKSRQLGAAQTVVRDRMTIGSVRILIRSMMADGDVAVRNSKEMSGGNSGAKKGDEKSHKPRERKPSDDKDLMMAFLRRINDQALLFLEFSTEAFAVMFADKGNRALVMNEIIRAVNHLLLIYNRMNPEAPLELAKKGNQ